MWRETPRLWFWCCMSQNFDINRTNVRVLSIWRFFLYAFSLHRMRKFYFYSTVEPHQSKCRVKKQITKRYLQKKSVQYFFLIILFPFLVFKACFAMNLFHAHVYTLAHKYLSSIYFPLWVRRTNTPHRIAATLIHLVQSQLQP